MYLMKNFTSQWTEKEMKAMKTLEGLSFTLITVKPISRDNDGNPLEFKEITSKITLNKSLTFEHHSCSFTAIIDGQKSVFMMPGKHCKNTTAKQMYNDIVLGNELKYKSVY